MVSGVSILTLFSTFRNKFKVLRFYNRSPPVMRFLDNLTVLILGISKSGGDLPPLHKMWERG